ncbi:uncharacterized protein LOC129926907 [Biomphalaria glabrata]|uniref:Uncharacterized protein LOC129926907 n=1 Tax=Biomphalaria glabrata TaxID=6526 RepID=A0A9W3AQI5_BIOGL|nr:uncharacterized protein LOC129926907 [Biomphalaria glabrata]XP_055889460.1 uncharacterized protein LOC129926907 [Biomphalaria glabrata]
MSAASISASSVIFVVVFACMNLGTVQLSDSNNITQPDSQDNSPYVEVNWRRSEEDQIGHHACTARKLDDNSEEVTCSTQVKFRQNRLDGLSEKTQSLQDRLKQLEATVEHRLNGLSEKTQSLQDRLNLLETTVERFQNDNSNEVWSNVSARVNTLIVQLNHTSDLKQKLLTTSIDINTIKNTLSNIRTEDGKVNCGPSDRFKFVPSEGLTNRVNFIRVNFQQPFSKIPLIWGSLRTIDVDKNTNLRYVFSVREVNTTGFTLGCHTWGDTRLAGIEYQWRATTPFN